MRGRTGRRATARTAHIRSTATRDVTGLIDGERQGDPRWQPDDAAGRVASEGCRHAHRRTNFLTERVGLKFQRPSCRALVEGVAERAGESRNDFWEADRLRQSRGKVQRNRQEGKSLPSQAEFGRAAGRRIKYQ